MKKQALICHSGGMDSSICLRLAIEKYGAHSLLSVGFDYGQRHSPELDAAKKICEDWGVDRVVLDLRCLAKITNDSLTNRALPIVGGESPNTLVVGRNGLMARLCAIHAHDLGAEEIHLGVMGLEGTNAGYRDCSRLYIDMMENILQHDLANPNFKIITPLVDLTKAESLILAKQMGVLDYLWEHTVTCYQGLKKEGCRVCPACQLRNAGFAEIQAMLQHSSC